MADKAAAERRLARIRSWMEERGASAFLMRGTSDIAWTTTFDGVFDDEQAHALLVTADAAVLHTDSRYSQACRREAGDGPVSVDAAPGSHASWCIARVAAGRLVFDDLMSLREHRALEGAARDAGSLVELAPTADAVLGMRAVKDEAEMERLKAAQAITDAGFSHIVGFIRPGLTEREVQAELDRFMLERGADGLSFPTIVATGAHGASPHAQPGGAVIRRGDAVVMDFGARKDGYCSDMTRMVFVGEPDAGLRAAYEVLRRANEECEGMVRAGVTGADVHARAQEVLAEGGFAGAMGHGLGHGVGIDIHEEPVLSPRNGEPLLSGAVVTVEPGIYLPGRFGMRLEDCGAVTDTGYEPFARSTHEMVVV